MEQIKVSPLEAICEFRFTLDTAWDMAVPGLVYKMLRDEFPVRKQRLLRDVECVLFFTEDGMTFIQLGPRLLSVHVLKSCPTWAWFKSKIELAFSALGQVVEIAGLERISLRYINRIDGLDLLGELGRCFRFHPPTFGLRGDVVDFSIDSEFACANGRDRCRIRFETIPTDDARSPASILDIDYFLVNMQDAQAVMSWLEKAHKRVMSVFDECLAE